MLQSFVSLQQLRQLSCFPLDSLCAALSEAIMNGKQEQALEIAKKLTSQKVNLSIKLKNPNLVTMDAGGNTIK